MVARAAMAKARAKSCLIEIISVGIGATKCDHGAAIPTFRIVCELFLLEVGRYQPPHGCPLIDLLDALTGTLLSFGLQY